MHYSLTGLVDWEHRKVLSMRSQTLVEVKEPMQSLGSCAVPRRGAILINNLVTVGRFGKLGRQDEVIFVKRGNLVGILIARLQSKERT